MNRLQITDYPGVKSGSRPNIKIARRDRLQIGIFSLCSLLSALCPVCYAQPISSAELINNAKQYDGKVVVYEGEVIGDIMVRGRYAWINVHDGKNAIGVWIEKGLTDDIKYTGSYKSIGDWVEVTGVFQRACLQHGGDLDIHAQGTKKIKPGRLAQRKLNLGKTNQAMVLLGTLGFIWILTRLKRK